MKPPHWYDIDDEDRHALAMSLLTSARGHFLVRRALELAAAEERRAAAVSNAEDMEMLAEGLFGLGPSRAAFNNHCE